MRMTVLFFHLVQSSDLQTAAFIVTAVTLHPHSSIKTYFVESTLKEKKISLPTGSLYCKLETDHNVVEVEASRVKSAPLSNSKNHSKDIQSIQDAGSIHHQ